MKSTQKKLKAKHFRYITKTHIENPVEYLNNFFKQEIDVESWLKEIDITLCAAAYPALNNHKFVETGFNCRRMVEQLEVAYVIYKQCHLTHLPVKLSLFENHDSYVSNILSDRIEPSECIARFFLFQSLNEWYSTMDDLLMYLTYSEKPNYELFGDKIIAIRAFWIDLVRALHCIYVEGGLEVTVPAYAIPKDAEPAE